MKKNKQFKRVLAVLLCVSLFLTSLLSMPFHAAAEKSENAGSVFSASYDRTAYAVYYSGISKHMPAAQKVQPDLSRAVLSDTSVRRYTNTKGSAAGIRFGDKSGRITLPFTVQEEGLYQLKLKYYPLEESALNLYVDIRIDGILPFTESGYCKLLRFYKDAELKQDSNGNDITPDTVQVSRWAEQYVFDTAGIYGNYYYYLTPGTHTISVESNSVPFLLEQISFENENSDLPSYENYFKNVQDKAIVRTYQKIHQAEQVLEKSTTSITLTAERTSPLLTPFDYDHSRVNILEGSGWINPGDFVSWEFEVPEDGLYTIGLKFRQSYLDGLFSSRKIYIDGAVPFTELLAVNFNYTSKWETKVLGENKPYYFYLTKGAHVLTLENVIGDLSETVDTLQKCVNSLNNLYLDIIAITGSTPDTNRDYYLEEQLPDLKKTLKSNAKTLFGEAERLSKKIGLKGSETAVLEDVAYQLESYAGNINSLTNNSRLDKLRENITTLSSKMSSLKQQGLDIDYFVVSSSDKEMPPVKMNFFQWLKHSVKMFFNSFSANEKNTADKDALRIWVSGGQEQLQIIRKMVNENFTPNTGIDASVQLVSGSLLQAAVSGKNPDVALNVESSVPINFALRGALQDLSGKEGFSDIYKQYREGSFTPYTLNGGVYGIPATETYAMVFVRTDIFARMGLTVPTTWEELLDLAPILQRKNMQIGLGVGFADLVYQYGGQYYNDALTEVAFNSNEGVEAFKTLTGFYTDYGFPMTYDFLTRFRSGEMPIAVVSYATYNSIEYSAPELKGLWEMYPLLGTRQTDGSINNVGVASPATVSIAFKNSKYPDEAWEFLKWWAEAKTQTAYGLALESTFGVSSRYNSANTITFQDLPWTDKELNVLIKQRENLNTLPILPGSYYVERCYNNAYRAVLNQGKNPREMLNKWVVSINEELARKQAEFDKNN